jgi:hypothetical protein
MPTPLAAGLRGLTPPSGVLADSLRLVREATPAEVLTWFVVG